MTQGLMWGRIRSFLIYMSCSTPADLREIGVDENLEVGELAQYFKP